MKITDYIVIKVRNPELINGGKLYTIACEVGDLIYEIPMKYYLGWLQQNEPDLYAYYKKCFDNRPATFIKTVADIDTNDIILKTIYKYFIDVPNAKGIPVNVHKSLVNIYMGTAHDKDQVIVHEWMVQEGLIKNPGDTSSQL